MSHQRQKLRKHQEAEDIWIEQEYMGDTFFMCPYLAAGLSEEEAANILWLYYCSIEELKYEYDLKHFEIKGSFAEALAGRKAA